jgi:hypothetical protein
MIRTLPSRVNQDNAAKTAYNIRAIGYRRAISVPVRCAPSRFKPAPAAATGSSRICSPSKLWCTGEDSNLRNSNEWQIYSLLPLTARPPVPKHTPSAETCRRGSSYSTRLRRKQPHSTHHDLTRSLSPDYRSMHLSGITAEDRPGALYSCRRLKLLCWLSGSGFLLWSWRRDLNPRPSDYKSDALPAELRQPDHPKTVPESTSYARTHSRSAHTTHRNQG